MLKPCIVVAAFSITSAMWGVGRSEHPRSGYQADGPRPIRSSAAEPQILSVDSTPVLSLGRAPRTGPNYEFGRVATTFFLKTGGFAVADNVAREVRLFSREGAFSRSIGRRGTGPGEIGFLGGAASMRGDSILVWDPVAARVSRFALDGTFTGQVARLATLTIEWLGTEKAVNARPAVIGVLDDGSVVARVSLPTINRTQARLSLSQDTLPLAVFSASGGLAARIGPLPGDEHFGGEGNVMERPFGARLKVAVRGNRIATGTGVRYDVTVFGASGNVVSRHARPEILGDQIDGTELAAYKEWYVRRFDEATRPSVRRELDAVPYPSRMPVFETLLWDSVGRLWVQRYLAANAAPREGSRNWDVLLPDGRWIDSVRMPAGLRVLDISADQVVGVVVDADGAEIVQIHAIRG